MNIQYLVVHCSDSPDDSGHTAKDVHDWHVARGFDGLGYHAVVERTGQVVMGRPIFWKGAHVRGMNSKSLGVCLMGRDHFNKDQMESLKNVLRVWMYKYPDAKVVKHNDLDKTKTCPNFDLEKWVSNNLK